MTSRVNMSKFLPTGLLAIGLLSSVGVLGCGSDDAGETDGPATTVTKACEGFETPFDTYASGIEKTGEQGLLRVVLVDALPAPPNRGLNAWTMQTLDASTGTPLDDVTLLDVTPFMPDHGHGTSVFPTHEWHGQDGLCDVGDIDFRMPGVWEVSFEMMTADSTTDKVVFAFCVEG
jgi:hypothetical protein